MTKYPKLLFILILIASIYHFIRDVFQIYGINNFSVDFFHWEHLWCRPFCDFVTIPPEIFNIIASILILKRNYIGILGKTVLISLIFWPIAVLLP